MKRYGILFAALVPLILAWAGCEGDAGPVGPNLKGDIYGICYAVDLSGVRATDNSGLIAKIEEKNITGTTDSTGRFVLRGVPTGTYTLSFLKTGYGTSTVVGLKFIGGGDIWWGSTNIFELPHFTVTGLAATPSPGNISLTATLIGSLPQGNRYSRYFVSTSPTVSPDPSKYMYSFWISANNTTATVSGNLTTATLNQVGISTGQLIYIIAYPEAYGITSFVDFATGRNHYTNIAPTPSNVVSVVVP